MSYLAMNPTWLLIVSLRSLNILQRLNGTEQQLMSLLPSFKPYLITHAKILEYLTYFLQMRMFSFEKLKTSPLAIKTFDVIISIGTHPFPENITIDLPGVERDS